MTIRRQLTLLVAAVAVPVIVLATVASARLWSLQREAHEQRYLERVSALRLALDTEFDGTIRLLSGLGSAENLGLGETPAPELADRFTQLLRTHPEWTVLGLAGADGRAVVSVTRAGDPPLPGPPAELLKGMRQPGVTELLTVPDGRRAAYVVAPVEAREPAVPGWLYVGETSDDWLRFLRRYPVSPDATLTIVDRGDLIVARTQAHERWVGQPVPASFATEARRTDEGSFETHAMDGSPVYAAFSRSRLAGWLVATGVASSTVEQALRQSTTSLVAGFLVTALVVAVLAVGIGSRIIGALSRLAEAAGRIGAPDAALGDDDTPLRVREAETVRRALRRASELIQARTAERAAAFEREAEARGVAERLNASKDEFIAMLGHELRNPLSALKSASTLLAMPNVPAAVKARSHEIVERQIGRLTALVDDMLDVARLESGKIALTEQRLDLSVLAAHVVEAFQSAGRCAHVTLEATLQSAWVDGDETRLEQIVANLLDNACKYTPPGGHVWLATGRAGAHAVLEVRDDGSGIAPELLPRVFDVFAQGQRTLARAEGGLGLGLAVVRRLVGLHGGTIAATSDGTGRGATFRLELPGREADRAAPVAEPGPSSTPAALRIVVVEDEPENRELYQLLLEEEGHAVVTAADGEAGVGTILAQQPEVAIVDIGLPGIDGFEVARRVRAAPAGPRPMLVAVTGYGTPADRDKALAAGFDAFLRKPFDLDAFLALVRERRGASS